MYYRVQQEIPEIKKAVEDKIGEEVNVSIDVKEPLAVLSMSCSIRDSNKDLVASFSLKELPGCCAYLVSHTTYVGLKYRGMGIASALQEIKVRIAKLLS